MNRIKNPILPGFHPDPSIIRVGEDYYIATSTFEWFPGVEIQHSKDLIHWRPVAHPLNRTSQLNLYGAMDNFGVWAPCLSYHDGVYYLLFSRVRTMNNLQKDCHNFLITATDICGEWSEPVLLKGNFADYSLFHEGDKKWLVFPCDYTDEGLPDAVICIQEYSPAQQKPVGPVIGIFAGTELGTTEGPHLYHVGEYYYLIVAEGGTSLGHAVTVARSRRLEGPYEADPQGPMLTARDAPQLPLQKAGHADLVQTQTGEWYLTHLCGRPHPLKGRCILGRETAIQKVVWSADGWLRLAQGGHAPAVEVEAPALAPHPWPQPPARDDFDQPVLDIRYQTPRVPLGEDTLSLRERPGWLRLKGKESLCSIYQQALVARRQQAFRYAASTCVEFAPQAPTQAAGLVCYYNTFAYHYLRVTYRRGLGKCIDVLSCVRQELTAPAEPVCVQGWARCYLRALMENDRLQFQYSPDGVGWKQIGPALDAGILTDELEHGGMMNFTGAFVGLCCQDLDGTDRPADFDFFEYQEFGDTL